MPNRIARRLTLGGVLVLVTSACTVSSTSVPPLAGPSGFALSFAVTATPDSILQDGASQSSITVTALDVNAKAISGLTFRMDMFVGGVAGDYGKLSGKTLVTGADGRASAVYTSPPPPAAGALLVGCPPLATGIPLPGTCVTISATPISTGFSGGTVSQVVVIHLVPIGVILPPANTPTPQFVITPVPVTTGVATNFDGSASCAGAAPGQAPPPAAPAACSPTSNTIVSYQWGFGDGGAAMGRTASHSYGAPGSYTVTLTVTNDGGKSATASQTIAVAASAVPTAVFVFSPNTPVIGQAVQFNASASTAVAGHSIVNYVWNWGDGATGTGQLTSHTYTLAGSYNVTLTVADDAGQVATATQPVPVGSGNPIAQLTLIKTGGTSIQADGSLSTASGSSTIVSYTFIWGDGTQTVSATPVVPHTYPALVPPALTETFTVTLRVTDNATPARSGTTSQPITLP
jgi:PKD repeat protein